MIQTIQVLFGCNSVPRLEARVIHALNQCDQNARLIISGSNQRWSEDISEAKYAENMLRDLGYKGEIVLDEGAKTTIQNVKSFQTHLEKAHWGQTAQGIYITDKPHGSRARNILNRYCGNVDWTPKLVAYELTVGQQLIKEPVARITDSFISFAHYLKKNL